MTRLANKHVTPLLSVVPSAPRNRRALPAKAKPAPGPTLVERWRTGWDPRLWPRVVGRTDGILYGTVLALIVISGSADAPARVPPVASPPCQRPR